MPRAAAGSETVSISLNLQRSLVQYLLKVGPPTPTKLPRHMQQSALARREPLSTDPPGLQEYREKGGQVTVPPNVALSGREQVDLQQLLAALQAGEPALLCCAS